MDPQPFVLATPAALRERHDSFDVYRAPNNAPVDDALRPAVVFVHGGPRPPGVEWRPRDQPVFVGYGSIAATAGVVGVVLEHHMASLAECAAAADEIATGLAQVRRLPGVDPNRIALWFFSGSGLLAADWLRDSPTWLTCLALTYPVLQALPEWGVEPRFDPTLAVRASAALPILLTRVGRDRPEFVSGVAAFVEAARAANLEIIDVPDGRHGFDMLDHSDESRSAVTRAMDWVLDHV
ncbi:alpha/beta hydrolase [Rhodococcus sp. 06-235-1A]|uniref:alpha/beta hydrolase n=1 Tax=Rhodococcus sp. 06-235-1A TaxID=2022508 RepID=UPI000B9C5321|nr:alpha/beta hydrolase [Rhodococcus sp. 06-235-1A]OZD07116.1 alpha/beta hydrolase [Rhodococcus sp. 06-235-1A]